MFLYPGGTGYSSSPLDRGPVFCMFGGVKAREVHPEKVWKKR
jgi:hypothetical protein